MYTQVVYSLERVPALAGTKPELAQVEPFKTVLSGEPRGDCEALHGGSREDRSGDAHRHAGRPVQSTKLTQWIATARDPRWKRPYTELTYQPMKEVLTYLRANGYKTYIVTGGGQDFVRVYAEEVYGIPPEQSRRDRGRHQVRLRQERQAVSHQGTEDGAQRQRRWQARRHPPDDRAPPVRGVRQLDRRPADAGVHQGRAVARACRCWCCTTMRRANMPTAQPRDCPTTKVGTFTQALYDEAKKQGWVDHQHEERLEADLRVRVARCFESTRDIGNSSSLFRLPAGPPSCQATVRSGSA